MKSALAEQHSVNVAALLPGPRILICKCGAAGDVLRTTPLLLALPDVDVDWLVHPKHASLLGTSRARILTSVAQLNPQQRYDVLFSLEEDPAIVSHLTQLVQFEELVGVYATRSGRIAYTDSARLWFDMSLISRLGIEAANRIKFENRMTYQDCLFSMAGLRFRGEAYLPLRRELSDRRRGILLAPRAGNRWPSKRWAFYQELAERLRPHYQVDWLGEEQTYLNVAEKIAKHSVVVANDSLPLHICLSVSVPVCGLFTCTSPWEIYDYGVLDKVVSARLWNFYYDTNFNVDAIRAIDVDEVLDVVLALLNCCPDGGSTLPKQACES